MTNRNQLFCSRWDCIPTRFLSEELLVRQKYPTDVIVSRFTKESWHNIFTDIHTDIELNNHLEKNSSICRAYILKQSLKKEPFGWIYICRKDSILCDVVEFHGGAWECRMGDARLKFISACIVIDQLLRLRIRVVSRAYKNNHAALKFLQSLGFAITHRSSQKSYVYLTLSRTRFYRQVLVRSCLNRVVKGR